LSQPSPIATKDDAESGLGRPLPVKLSRIMRFEGQPRRHFDQKGLEDLADDILDKGQKTPVRVCKHSEQKGVFVLIGGERRWRAFGIIRDRTNTDPVVDAFIDIIYDERHHFREAFFDNLQREDLVPVDEAAAYRRLYIESTARSHHAKVTEIAKDAKKSFTHVENYLYMDSLPGAVKDLMNPLWPKSQRLTVTAAIEIARSTDNPTLQLAIAKEAIERDLGVAETRGLISLKTGRSGYGVSGRLRKPSDDYRVFKSFLLGTLHRAKRFEEGLDINALYETRDDENYDRETDAKALEILIGHLNNIHESIKGK